MAKKASRTPAKPIVPLTRQSNVPVAGIRTSIPVNISPGFAPAQLSYFDTNGHFNRSLSGGRKRLTPQQLVAISRTPIFSRAIERISTGVAAMPTIVTAPEDEDLHEKDIKNTVKRIQKAVRQPSAGWHDTYTKFIKAVIRDLLIFGCSLVERQEPLDDESQAFWLWPVNVQNVKLDPRWEPHYQEFPRYWYCPPNTQEHDWKPLFDENAFLITARASSFEVVPPSPVELAYKDVCAWLKLHEYQNETVGNAVRDYMINLKGAQQEEVDAFREYWENEVVQNGIIPIVGAEGVDVVKFGARNDEELYPGYAEFMVGLIALEFGLLKSDFGYVDHANYSTADIASQQSFQEGIRPIADCTTEHLELKAVDFYYPGYGFALSDRNPQKEKDEADRSNVLFGGDIATKNEAREMNGLDPVPGGDKFKSGSSSTDDEPEAVPGTQQEQPVPEQGEEIGQQEIAPENGNGNGKKPPAQLPDKNGKKPVKAPAGKVPVKNKK
jgi:hypothetical protein